MHAPVLSPVLVTPPAEPPVSLTEAKDQLRVTHADQDSMILRYINAATDHLDGHRGILGRCIVTQRWQQDFWGWGVLALPFPDASNVTVTYLDSLGVEQTVLAANYRTEGRPGSTHVIFSTDWAWPSLFTTGRAPVRVAFDAGYGAASAVPDDIRSAILIHVQAQYDGWPDDKWARTYEQFIRKHRVERV